MKTFREAQHTFPTTNIIRTFVSSSSIRHWARLNASKHQPSGKKNDPISFCRLFNISVYHMTPVPSRNSLETTHTVFLLPQMASLMLEI